MVCSGSCVVPDSLASRTLEPNGRYPGLGFGGCSPERCRFSTGTSRMCPVPDDCRRLTWLLASSCRLPSNASAVRVRRSMHRCPIEVLECRLPGAGSGCGNGRKHRRESCHMWQCDEKEDLPPQDQEHRLDRRRPFRARNARMLLRGHSMSTLTSRSDGALVTSTAYSSCRETTSRLAPSQRPTSSRGRCLASRSPRPAVPHLPSRRPIT